MAKIISEGKGRKTVNLKTTMTLDQKRRTHTCDTIWPVKHFKHTCVPEKTVPIPDFTLPYLCQVEYANTEANIVEDAVRVFLVELVDEGLFWGKTELRGVYRYLVLLHEK